RVFVLDTTQAPRDVPDPDWSRIAVYDFDGNFQGDIRRYDAQAPGADDALRTWYDDIGLDPARQRVYVTARRTGELLALGYDGKLIGRAPGRYGLAVLPDGRVAVGTEKRRLVQLYDPDLKPLRTLELPADLENLEADAAGRLYASTTDPAVT